MIQYLYLGRVDYGEVLSLQQELVALRQAGQIGNVLLLLEHPPVLTLGRNASRSNILASDELLARRGVTLHEINRGGDVTYHGPGQLIGYPIFDLRSLRNPSGHHRLGPVDFVRLMEEALVRVCGDFGVHAGRICGLTGVWCGLPEPQNSSDKPDCEAPISSKGLPSAGLGRKIAAIGIHVARGVTSHGFAFNLTTNLGDFALINPCGITDRPVTSLEREVAELAACPPSNPSHTGPHAILAKCSMSRSRSSKASPPFARRPAPIPIREILILRRPNFQRKNFRLKTRRSRFRPRSSVCDTAKTGPFPHRFGPGTSFNGRPVHRARDL